MKKLHDIVTHAYSEILKPFFRIEILSDGGWQEVRTLNITEAQPVISLKTSTGLTLRCSRNHIVFTGDGDELLAEKSLGKTIRTRDGTALVTEISDAAGSEQLYDVSLAENSDHTYYANGVLSHNCVIVDEMAFIPKNIIDEFFASVMPVVSSAKNSKVIVVSTPNGTSGLYYDIWQQANSKDAKKNKEGWKPFRIDWFEVPGRTKEWKEKQIASIGERRFSQEFGNEFISGSDSKKLIPDDIIEKYRMRLSDYKTQGLKPKECKILAETEDKVFKFDMWHEFRRNRTYAASGDISEGVGGDDSVLYIWDVTDTSNIRMCAKFSSSQVSLVEFAYVCLKMLALYGNPPFFAERNGVSAGTLDSLRITYKYDNIPIENKKGEPGIYSHVTVKTRAELWAREMFTTDGFGFTIYDKDLVDELGTFVKKDNKGVQTVFAAASGAHDDHVMALIWLCWAVSSELVDKYFIVCQDFTSVFGQIYPKLLQPLKPYDPATLTAISKDPVYNDFLEFKRESSAKVADMQRAIEKEDANDCFRYTPREDPYFGGYDDEPSWNSQNPSCSGARNPNNHMPVFFV